VPLVADIHFNPELAIGAIECGADKVRINPGNIGSDRGIRKIVDAAKHAGIPMRIGVNSGSLEKHLLQAHGGPTAQALFESARENVSKLEAMGCRDMVVSLKASDVPTTINACRLFSLTMDIPQHIGITESGTVRTGTVRSAVGIGTLLAEGIGDTIRVSLAGDPLDEVVVGRGILTSLGLMAGPTVIACPTCGRTTIDVAGLAHKVEEMVASIDVPIKVAVMGCVVNGPGEARDADVGIAGATDGGSIFVKGECVEKVKPDRMLDALWGAVMRVVEERKTEG